MSFSEYLRSKKKLSAEQEEADARKREEYLRKQSTKKHSPSGLLSEESSLNFVTGQNTKASSFSEYLRSKRELSAEQEENDAKKRERYLSLQRNQRLASYSGVKSNNKEGLLNQPSLSLTKDSSNQSSQSYVLLSDDSWTNVLSKPGYVKTAPSVERYLNEPDYEKYSTIGANIKNPTVKEAEGWANIFGWRPGAKEVGNIVTYSRENATSIGLSEMNTNHPVGSSKYSRMTEDEVGVYNYLLGKYGKEKADAFLDEIDEELNIRTGKAQAEALKSDDLNVAAKAVGYTAASLGGGVDSFSTGVKQAFSKEQLPVTAMSVANQEIASDLDGFESILYSAGNTVGQMAPSIVASYMTGGTAGPIVGAALMGTSASGNAYARALEDGYSEDDARAYSALVGLSEAGLQYAMGGIAKLGGKGVSNIANKIDLIDNSLLRIGAKYGYETVKEIGEEELQNYLEPAFRTIIFGEKYDAPTADELIETAFVTALSTNAMNVSTDVSSGNVNRFTNSERQVVKTLYEDTIAERESNGKKLTEKEKTEIYETIVDNMEHGQLDINDIERVLGGESYTAYKDAADSNSALKKELADLQGMEYGKMNDLQHTRLNELKGMNLDDTTKINDLRKQLNDKVFSQVKDSYLAESYNEIARAGQAFEVDLTEYKGKQKAAVERAMNSGVLNNTYRSHVIVDTLSKIEADKGIVFDYTDNAKLKDSGFAVEGKTVNGYVDTSTGAVTLNVQSAKAWQSVVGHEITHVLEGTDAYNDLRNALYTYAESKGELASRKAALTELYKDIEKTDIDAELTADLVGDYLFTDKEFISKLATNRNLFQRIYDEIKYLCKVATGKELTEIEKVKREFDNAWKELSKNNKATNTDKQTATLEPNVNYSISPENLDSIEEKYKDKTDHLYIHERKDGTISIDNMVVKSEYRNQGVGSEILNDILTYADANGKTVTLTPTSEFGTKAKLTKWYKANGFVENKGRNTDFTLSDTMYRLPKENVKYSLSTDNPDIRYSISEVNDAQYQKAVESGDTATAQSIVEKTAEIFGYNIRAYHGTARGDRVGNVFLPERATSGPMAFFTSDKQIAENYSKSKQDTSMAYDPDYDRYETQFRIKRGEQDLPLYRAWNYLPYDAKQRITEKASQLREDWDGDGDLILDPETNEANGGFQWQLKEARGNTLLALTEQWLNSGTLFNEEGRFLDVLKMAGVNEEFEKIGMDNLYFKDPNAKHEKVYDTFLKITTPFDTANVNEEFIADLEKWYDAQDQSKYDVESQHADLWDKNNRDVYDYVNVLRDDLANNTTHAWTSIPDAVTDYLKSKGYDGIKDTGGKYSGETHIVYIPFSSEQIKSAEPITYDDNGEVIPLNERFNPDNVDIRYSLSNKGEQIALYGDYNTPLNSLYYGRDIAPVEDVTDTSAGDKTAISDAPIVEDYSPAADSLEAQVYQAEETVLGIIDEANKLVREQSENRYTEEEYNNKYSDIMSRYVSATGKLDSLLSEVAKIDRERFESISDADVPPQMAAPYRGEGSEPIKAISPLSGRDINEVGKRNVKAYMYEDPDIKPFFQDEASGMLYDLQNGLKGERYPLEDGSWTGTKRHTTDDIAELLDDWGYSYAQIEEGLRAIKDGSEAANKAVSKRIEFMLDRRLRYGYTDVTGYEIPPNQEYIDLLISKQISDSRSEADEMFMLEADEYAPPENVEDIAPVNTDVTSNVEQEAVADVEVEQGMYDRFNSEQIAPEPKKHQPAKILSKEPVVSKKKNRTLSRAIKNFVDKGAVFENLSLKTKNRELQAKYNFMYYSTARAQQLIGNGTKGVKSLTDIIDTVEKSGKTERFYEYLYHKHNIDRMSLESAENQSKRMSLRENFKGYSDESIETIAREWITKDTPKEREELIRKAREYVEVNKDKNKPVFDYSVTADVSKGVVNNLEKANPEFRRWAKDVYNYNSYLRKMLVDNGVISQETAELWEKTYPNYVPIRRVGHEGPGINIPLDTNKTGINAPIKKATGGNSDILPLFGTMAQRTMQTYKALAKNRFGVELKNTLNSTIENTSTTMDEVIDSFDNFEDLLQEGKNGSNPTFTVFENGERVTFEITEEMYEALQPTSEELSKTYKIPNAYSNFRRKTLTEYNLWFLLKNATKDIQDVFINSQHATKTYLNIPTAIKEMVTKGELFNEYVANGGEQNTYFDNETNTFTNDNKVAKAVKTVTGLNAIAKANNVVEMLPRFAEYIASRKAGRSVEVSMLDAARVTTNFQAGGDITKFLNRNGATFLNASVQGAMQQVRNIREAKMNGLRGWVNLAAKYTVAGLPALLLNGLIWDDDEEYEELSDYVKQNYYIVGKYGDGKFVRIPKGRAVAVIQNAFEQMENAITGDDEVDLKSFLDLAISNLAPNNPLDNNIISPIIDVAKNETWYGEDLVPSRMQDLPASEQYDETTDEISKWLGETFDVSPMKVNYLLDQYSGVLGDTFLPMITPEAESGTDSFGGKIIAPLKDMFTTDSVMKNQNISDFYSKKEELTINANSSGATDEDVLKSKYMDSVNADLSELYKTKREIQNGNMPDNQKYNAVREVQKQITDITKDSLNSYENVNINGDYATVADRHYHRNDEGEWVKINDEQLEKQNNVTSKLGISAAEYWENKEEYDYAYKSPEKYAVAKSVGGYDAYKSYSSELDDIKADKDSNGNSISGSKKEKVVEYINNLDIDYGAKIILFKYQYPKEDTYNEDIINYLNEREDITYEEMTTILTELGFKVVGDTVYWD